MPLMKVSRLIQEKVSSRYKAISAVQINTILTEGYKASLLREEERPVKFRIQLRCSSHRTVHNIDLFHDYFFLKLDAPFVSSELRKLSQAIDFSRSSIVVEFNDSKPRIAGVFSTGAKWPKFLLFESSGVLLPEETLSFSFNKPGNCCIHYGITRIIEISLPDVDTIDEKVSTNEDALLDSESFLSFKSKFQNSKEEIPEASNVERLFLSFLGSLVIRAMLNSHGGTILVAEKTQLVKESLRMKYDLYFKDALISAKDLFCYYLKTKKKEPEFPFVQEKISSYADFLAGFTKIDGALLLNSDFSIMGIGAEIAIDPNLPGNAICPLSANHGMRHRSAFYFVRKIPNSLAVVISQDGGNKVLFRRKGEVEILENFQGERLNFLL